VCLVHVEFLSRNRFPAFLIPFPSGYSCYLSCVSVSRTRSDPPSRVAPSLSKRRLCFFLRYYEDSVAIGLSSRRRSRVCAYGTLTALRCPFVPYQAHCPQFAKEGLAMSSKNTWCFGVATVRRE